MKHCFSTQYHIRTKAQYQQVFAAQKRLVGRFYVFFYRRNALSHPRLGIIVQKRNVRHAVVRNRIKRQVREMFRLYKPSLPPIDIVVVTKAGINQVDKREWQPCLEKLMKQLIVQQV